MDITIEKLVYGGEGLAHHEGAAVFIPFVLPAERVAAAAVEEKKKFVRARLERLIEPSPDRAVPPCPHFGVCGGCDYQHISYDAQLRYKTEILRETLRRLGRIDWTGGITAHASPPWAYRNRAQWKVRRLDNSKQGDATAGEPEKMALGYFRANSTALCAINQCSILSPLLLKTMLALRDAVGVGKLPKSLREIEVFTDTNDAKLLLTATFAGYPARASELAQTFRSIVPEAQSLLLHDPATERMALDGPGYIECNVGGLTYRVGHFSFFQVNRFLLDELVRHVATGEPSEDASDARLALDLFAGVGLFALPLAKRFQHVVAVESNPAASRDLESNVQQTRPVEVRAMEVERFLEKYKGKPDRVVIDPPRAGLEPTAVRHLARIAPARITYVSCDPPTLARDLATLVQAGYELSAVHLFDLFPQTFHMETVVHLRRRA
jgi:23S rRNA (uracil1939-C5)-methyltransferase